MSEFHGSHYPLFNKCGMTHRPVKSNRDQVGTKSGPSRALVPTDSRAAGLLARMQAEHAITELMTWAQRANRTKFRDQCLTPLLEQGLMAMTIPDKPQSSKQRYRLTERGAALRAGRQHQDKTP